MTAEKKTDRERPTGSQRKDEDERVREEGEEASAGTAPIDPADEQFIESSK
jgi:hypothetical protein